MHCCTAALLHCCKAHLEDPNRPIMIAKPATRGEGKGIFLVETVEQLNAGTSYGMDKLRQTFIVYDHRLAVQSPACMRMLRLTPLGQA